MSARFPFVSYQIPKSKRYYENSIRLSSRVKRVLRNIVSYHKYVTIRIVLKDRTKIVVYNSLYHAWSVLPYITLRIVGYTERL